MLLCTYAYDHRNTSCAGDSEQRDDCLQAVSQTQKKLSFQRERQLACLPQNLLQLSGARGAPSALKRAAIMPNMSSLNQLLTWRAVGQENCGDFN